MQIFRILLILAFAAGASAAAKPPLYDLVLPDGFTEIHSSEKRGFALISRQTTQLWMRDQKVKIQLNIDNSHRASEANIAGYGLWYVKQIREQASGDYEIGDAFRYTIGGKKWVLIALSAKDASKFPDKVVIITELAKSIAVLQVAAMRADGDLIGPTWAELLKLNSPATEVADTPAGA